MQPSEQVKRFAQELTAFQRSLYVYISTLTAHPADALDVLQETNREVWERYEEFQPGSNLAAWMCKIAYFQVLTLRKRKSRETLRFRDTTLSMLADRSARIVGEIDSQQEALQGCLEKLAPADRELVRMRYLAESDIEAMAKHFRRPAKSLYRSLARI